MGINNLKDLTIQELMQKIKSIVTFKREQEEELEKLEIELSKKYGDVEEKCNKINIFLKKQAQDLQNFKEEQELIEKENIQNKESLEFNNNIKFVKVNKKRRAVYVKPQTIKILQQITKQQGISTNELLKQVFNSCIKKIN